VTREQQIERARAALRRSLSGGPDARVDELEGIPNGRIAGLLVEVMRELDAERVADDADEDAT
jgi:hypothetical protein